MFTLFYVVTAVLLSLVDGALGLARNGGGPLSGLYSLAVVVPGLAVTIRRLHDTNHSGWWVLINLVPLVGWIWLLIFLVTDSDPGENRYGPNPKVQAT